MPPPVSHPNVTILHTSAHTQGPNTRLAVSQKTQPDDATVSFPLRRSIDRETNFVTVFDRRDGDVVRHQGSEGSQGIVAGRIDRLATEEGVQAQRLRAGLAFDIEDGQIDRTAEVSLHVQHVAALADPVSEQGLEARAVRPDLPDLL